MTLRAALLALAMGASCAAPRNGPSLRDLAPQGAEKYAVVIFFSANCHVLSAHDARIRELAADYAARGIRFLALDPEVDATGARDREEADRRGYPFPILVDEGGKIAKSVGATYAGHAFVFDRAGAVLYQGGIDSDRVHLTDDATPYLRNALADLVAGRSPRVADAKVLGCALRTW
jgi:hypothetical protein